MLDASKVLGSPCSGKVEIKETDGTCGRKKEHDLLSLFMEVYGLEVEEEISTIATQFRAEGVWTGKWRHEQKEAWMRRIREVQLEHQGEKGEELHELEKKKHLGGSGTCEGTSHEERQRKDDKN